MGIKRPGQGIPSFEEMRRKSPKAGFIGRDSEPEETPIDPPVTAKPVSTPAPLPEAEKAATRQHAPAKSPRPEVPRTPEETVPPPSRAKSKSSSPNADKSVVLKGYVPVPAQGFSRFYDRAAASYGEKKALQLILTTALSEYEQALKSGQATEAADAYPVGEGGMKVSRTMRMEAFKRAKAIFDPLNMLPEGTLASTICRNALVFHLSKSRAS